MFDNLRDNGRNSAHVLIRFQTRRGYQNFYFVTFGNLIQIEQPLNYKLYILNRFGKNYPK